MYNLYKTIRYYAGYSSINNIMHPVTGIPITFSSGIAEDVINKVVESLSQPNSKFNKWYFKCIDNNIDIRSVKIDAVTMFGPNVGFLYLTADSRVIKNKETEEMQQLPGVTFIRGDAVCCLFVIKNTTNDTYNMVLVEQARVPISQRCLETPAGMLDGSNQFTGTMVKEIKEETKIDISGHGFMSKSLVENSSELPFHTLMELGEFIPSQGGCDERLKVFAYACEKTQDEIKEINDRITGEASEHEHIIVRVQDLTWENIDATNDSKLLVAASKFDRSFPGIIKKN